MEEWFQETEGRVKSCPDFEREVRAEKGVRTETYEASPAGTAEAFPGLRCGLSPAVPAGLSLGMELLRTLLRYFKRVLPDEVRWRWMRAGESF
jgi:hypothetical protein